MKKLFVVLCMIAMMLLPQYSFATTTKITGNVIEITGLSADWLWSDFPQLDADGISIICIIFHSDTLTDKLVIFNEAVGLAGLPPIYVVVANQTMSLPLFGAKLKLVIDFSASAVAGTETISIITK